MKREGKSRGGGAEKEENLGEKLKRWVLVGKKEGPCTPLHSWQLFPSPSAHDCSIPNHHAASVSARKLAAVLWEFHHYNLPLAKMHRPVQDNPGPSADSRLPRRRHQHKHQLFKEQSLHLSHFLEDPCPSSSDQPESAGSLRRHIAQSLMQHHQLIERSNSALQPVSPASYGSSMEVAPYDPAVTPTSSLDFRGRVGASNYNLKTSTELLKVLNRIWSLEEQHSSNISLIKALKTELEHARGRIKELLQDQQADRHEIDDLMKQIAEDKVVRKTKEHDRIHAAVQSARNELEDERKLRKRSESLHRKLAREVSEVKSSLSNALKEVERETKSRKLLENLCDELAKEIKDYEQEVHSLKQKSEKDWAGRADHDRLILHISESWLDERMQMKLEEAQSVFVENKSIVEKLGFEIETFLQARRKGNSKGTDYTLPTSRDRRHSLESVILNDTVSALQDVGNEEDSAGSGSNCFELNKPSNAGLKSYGDEAMNDHIDENVKLNHANSKPAFQEKTKSRNPSSLQVKFEEQIAWAMSCNGNKKSKAVEKEEGNTGQGKPVEISISRRSENCEVTEEGSHERKNKLDEIHGNSNYVMDNMIRNHILLSEGGNIQHPENDYGEASCSYSARRNQASPVRQWMPKTITPDLGISESSTKLPLGLKDNTLKAKLLEARSKGQRSRFKVFKSSS